MRTIDQIVETGAISTVFQPIVDLRSERIVAYEALSRGPAGALHRPDLLFAAAREAGLEAQLDAACRTSALRSARAAGVRDPLTLFVNVEPGTIDCADLDELIELARGLDVVLEITERAIAARPAELLATARRLRSAGWRIALDDVGADRMSLAFMPLLRPDVVKLDLSLVQRRPGQAVAEIMNAVNAYAERTGALVLAEGIEDERHMVMAEALGAELGQGWLFGRPEPTADPFAEHGRLTLPPAQLPSDDTSAFAHLPPGTELRRSTKALLVEVSRYLEREAARLGRTCLVLSTFQHVRHFTPQTRNRYRRLAVDVGFVAAIGEGISTQPLPGVRGADLDPSDPIRQEWDIVVLAPHFSAALLARDLGDDGPDLQRRFEFALTYDRDAVAGAAEALMTHVVPVVPVQPTVGRTVPAA
jgi:EAL domain-containing protein (putative c-di-GMP-specific phosphodiesterase class I)